MNLHGILYYFAKAAITKYHSLSGLNNRNVFVTVLEAEMSRIMMPVDSVFCEGFLVRRQCLLLCPRVGEGVKGCVGSVL